MDPIQQQPVQPVPQNLADMYVPNPNYQQPVQQVVQAAPAPKKKSEPVAPQITNIQVQPTVVYKKQRVHGFFRTLTIIVLAIVGLLMLLDSLNIVKLSLNGFNFTQIYPIIVLFSTIIIWSYRGIFGKIFGLILFLVVVGGFVSLEVYIGLNPSTKSKYGEYVAYPASTYSANKLYVNTLISAVSFKAKDTTNLVEGNFGSDRSLLAKTGTNNNYAYLILNEDNQWNILQNYYSVLDLGLSTKKSFNIYDKSLASMQTLDLKNVRWYNLRYYGAASMLDLDLGDSMQNNSTIDIQLAIGDVVVRIPKNIGVNLHYKHLFGTLNLNDFGSKGSTDFVSKNISQAKKTIDINVNMGFSKSFTVVRY